MNLAGTLVRRGILIRRGILSRLALVGLCGLATAVPVFAASPRLTTIMPRGIQRGIEHELTFSGNNLGDADEIFFYEPGFEVVNVEGSGNQCKVTVRVAPDCRLGEHVAQVRTASGISDYRTLYVGALPAVAEVEPNTDFDAPQPIAMNVTVTGVIQTEDVDYFLVEAKKGQRISVEVEAMRLGNTLFDPYVAILDMKRFELASADDTPLILQDSAASIVAPEDGKYVIEVRESAYGGNGNCHYRLHVGTFPRPTAIYPAGGKVGEEVEVRFVGDPAQDMITKVTLPSEITEDFGLFAEDEGGIAPSPNPFRLFEHGNAFEVEPNNDVASATLVELPLAFNGIIEESGDVDCFKFKATKGQVFEVECFGRRIRSALDPVMNLYYADGRGIAGNDDSRGPDSYIRFTVPEDGEYVVRVTDHLGRGGPDFVYRIEFQPVRPALTLGIPRVERYGQYRQQIYVAQGNRFGTLLTASRANFGGELLLDSENLPAGMTMLVDPIPANLNQVPVVFEATADAPISGKLIDLIAKHADPNQNIQGKFTNRADFVVSAPGQSLYRWRDVDQLAVAVVEELPFKIDIVQPNVPIVRNGSMELKIVATRKEGFTKPINVQFPFRPPGVGAGSSVTIPEGQNEVLYPLSANGNAEVKPWKVFALGSADVTRPEEVPAEPDPNAPRRRRRGGAGAGWSSSQLATLEVSEPYVTFEIQRASCEQGQEAQVYCKINHLKPFEGTAKVELTGLPAKTTTTNLEFTKDTPELTFIVKTEPDSPAGKHKTLFCQLTITQNGEPIVSNAGGTELQIDVPLPAPAKPAAAPMPAPMPVAAAAPMPAAAAPPKPLSRLEKLRIAAQERKDAEANANAGGGE